MIIDSHEHVMLPIKKQVDNLKKAGIDKAILFCTTSHPEQANSLNELKQEMNMLFQVLTSTNDQSTYQKKNETKHK